MVSFYNKLKISRTEFLFQFQSHPNYPSLLAFSDTLNFLNLKNKVYEINKEDWNELPEQFIVIYKNEYTLIIKKDNEYLIFNDKNDKISKEKLYSNSQDIVFIFDDIADVIRAKNPSNKWVINILFTLIILFAYLHENRFLFIYNLLTVTGLFVSLELFNSKFGEKSTVINTFCSNNAKDDLDSTNNCTKIFNSDKLSLLGLKLSDFSLIYFLGLSILGIFLKEINLLLKCFSMFSIFVIIYSLYIQIIVEKIYCKICMIIIIVLSFQITISQLFFDNSCNYDKIYIAIFTLLLSLFTVKYINDILNQKQNYYALSLKAVRFKKNYDIFKRELKIKHFEFEHKNKEFWIGNEKSKLHISLITNPYCVYCKDTIQILKKIVTKYPEISIQLRFNYLASNKDDDLKSIISIFRNIFQNKGQYLLLNAIEFWHNKNDLGIFKNKYKSFVLETELDDVIKLGEENIKLGLTYTPQILINNYLFPHLYEREDILYFIDELMDDEEILNEKV